MRSGRQRRRGLCAVVLAAACGGGRSGEHATIDTAAFATVAPSAPLDSTLRIVVTDQPQVYVNGRAVTLAGLDSLLDALQRIDGEVWYFSQPPDPHRADLQNALVDSILGAVSRHGLALRASRRGDFGDLAGRRRRAPAGPP